MYIFAIFSSLICLQLITTVLSGKFLFNLELLVKFYLIKKDTNDAGQFETPSIVSLESDEEYNYVPRSTSFLRFGRQLPSSSGAFLRFGRSPSNFLRFGRSSQNGGTFLRFGRQAASNNFLRFGKKGEFLRFG
jgi:hypothetical protein